MPLRHKAFSLVELLTVIAILSVLAALLLPTVERSIEEARRIACLNTHRQLALTTMAFANDHKDRIPCYAMWWAGGNREMADVVFDWNYQSNFIWWYNNHLGPLGVMAAWQYVTDPALYYCPSTCRSTIPNYGGGSIGLDQPQGAAAWRNITAGANMPGLFSIYSTIVSTTVSINGNVLNTDPNKRQIQKPTMTYIASHWRDSLSSDPVAKKVLIGPMLYACLSTASIGSWSGPFYPHMNEGVNSVMYDGSGRWIPIAEPAAVMGWTAPLENATYWSAPFLGWERSYATPWRP